MTHPLYCLLKSLDAGNWHYALARHRPDSILVSVAFVGIRMEIDVFDDGHMEVCQFEGNEDIIEGEEIVQKLLSQNR